MTAEHCKGDAVAKSCEENLGVRVDLHVHMRKLWKSIGFQPTNFQLDLGEDNPDSANDVKIKDSGRFSPNIVRPETTEEDRTKYNGVTLKNFPKDTKKDDIIELLMANGLPEDFSTDNIVFGNHGNLEIRNILPQNCQEIISKKHYIETRQTFYGKPIYCKATRDLTPVKPSSDISDGPNDDEDNESEKLSEAAATIHDDGQNDDEDNESDKLSEAEATIHDDFVFEYEPIDNINSKLITGGDESFDETEDEDPNPATKFLKNHKRPASTKPRKRNRPTPSSTINKKIEKKTKTL